METIDRVKRIGGRCFDVGLAVFLIAILVVIWNSSRTRAESAIGNPAVKTHKTRNRIASINALGPIQGTVCIKDDSNRNEIQFDQTGLYTFTDCKGFTLGGTGILGMKGLVITLSDVKTDRRLDLTFDMSVNRAKMGLQVFTTPLHVLFTIADRNTKDDICGCQ